MIVCVSCNQYFYYGICQMIAEHFPKKEVYSSDAYSFSRHLLDELISLNTVTAIVDYSYPDRSLIFSLMELKRRSVDMNVIFVADIQTNQDAVENILIDTVTDTLIDKKVSLEKICHCLHVANSGQIITHSVMNMHWAAIKKNARLTHREIDIFPYIISGSRNKEISRNINISQKTVSIHRRHIYAKLRVTSLAGLYNILVAHNGMANSGAQKNKSH